MRIFVFSKRDEITGAIEFEAYIQPPAAPDDPSNCEQLCTPNNIDNVYLYDVEIVPGSQGDIDALPNSITWPGSTQEVVDFLIAEGWDKAMADEYLGAVADRAGGIANSFQAIINNMPVNNP